MARYGDLDALAKKIKDRYCTNCDHPKVEFCRQCHITDALIEIEGAPAADVVPRSEVDKLEYTLLGVMHSVDKWLDGDELEQDEVNRAITMREKTLQIVENVKIAVAEEIFEEIKKHNHSPFGYVCLSTDELDAIKQKIQIG